MIRVQPSHTACWGGSAPGYNQEGDNHHLLPGEVQYMGMDDFCFCADFTLGKSTFFAVKKSTCIKPWTHLTEFSGIITEVKHIGREKGEI